MDELPQRIQDRLKKKDYILSEIFESPKADKETASNRTICEIFRTLYALTVIHLKDNPEALRRQIIVLEEGFVVGMKMVNRMVKENASFVFDSIAAEQVKKETGYRAEKNRITSQLGNNTKFMEKYRKA